MRVSRSVVKTPDPLFDRRTRIAARREQANTAIRVSEDQIVSCPSDENILLSILNRVPREPRRRRPGNHLHVSDLLSKCLRKFALVERYGVAVRPQRLTPSDVFTFAMGDAIHDSAKMMAAVADPDKVWGKWKCKCGHLYHDQPGTLSEFDMEEVCPQCDTPTNHYVEVPMVSDEHMIVGTPDLLLYMRDINAFHVTELKSIAPDQFKELSRPKPDHILQVLFYWFLMRHLGYRLTDKVSILYITKGYIFKGSVYKEFVINPQEQLHRLDPYLEEARLVKGARTDKTVIPLRSFCQTEYSAQAKRCEVCDYCFSKKYS